MNLYGGRDSVVVQRLRYRMRAALVAGAGAGVRARFSTPDQTGPEAHSVSCAKDTGVIPGGKAVWVWT